MSLCGKSQIHSLDQRAQSLGFRDIRDLANWIYLGIDERTIVRWKVLDIDPKPAAFAAIDALLSQIESDPRHYIRNFARYKERAG